MQYMCLNPRLLPTREDMLSYLAAQLSVEGIPNLDALYDVLTCPTQPLSVLCLDYQRDGQSLYPYAGRVYRVLADAAKVNRALRVDVVRLPGAQGD